MDNNAAERALRGPVVGRKNYYGSGSRWSARLAAVAFTILQTLELWRSIRNGRRNRSEFRSRMGQRSGARTKLKPTSFPDLDGKMIVTACPDRCMSFPACIWSWS